MEPFNYDALKGIQCETELSCKFFSKKNIMHLHSEIIKAVQDKLKVNIDKQSDQELVIIMRAIFLQNAYESSDVARELKNLNLKVLIHCFTGSKDFAKKLLDIGCYISLSGIVTFKKSTDLQKTAEYIPIDRLLVETDSPYLAPAPLRGKSNEPSFIIHTINKLAEIKNSKPDEIEKNTTLNFLKLFDMKF